MKKFLTIALALVAGFGSYAQQKAEDLVKFDTEKFDFGKIKQGVPATTFFTITNTSDKPVVIERAWAGCGCTTPEYSSEPFASNGTTKVKVGYNAANMGHFEKDVFVKFAGVNEPKVIKITGDVVDASAFDAMVKDTKPSKTSKDAKTEVKKTKSKKPTESGK